MPTPVGASPVPTPPITPVVLEGEPVPIPVPVPGVMYGELPDDTGVEPDTGVTGVVVLPEEDGLVDGVVIEGLLDDPGALVLPLLLPPLELHIPLPGELEIVATPPKSQVAPVELFFW